MIRVENVSVDYGLGDVVHDLSFSVSKGEKFCIAGPNGSGKSTLVQALGRLLPYKGRIYFEGEEIRQIPRRKLAASMALLSQIPALYFAYSVRQTVAMGRYPHVKGRLSGLSRADWDAVDACLEQMGILDIADRPITQISGGQLQRTLLARVFAQSPKVILLDEPLNHLDLACQVELLEHLEYWQKETQGVIIAVFHDLNLVRLFADRVLLLDSGRMAALDECGKVLAGETVNRVFGMDVSSWMRSALAKWEKI